MGNFGFGSGCLDQIVEVVKYLIRANAYPQFLVLIYLPWRVIFLVAVTVDGGVSVVDWQAYCPPWDVCRGLNERVRMVVEPVVL